MIFDAWDNDYRHRCQEADRLYALGIALVFFDIDEELWFLAHPSDDAHTLWFKARTRVNPLQYRAAVEYPARQVVDHCPWCGVGLLNDPDLAMADAEDRLVTGQPSEPEDWAGLSWLAPQDYGEAPVKAVGEIGKMVCPACGFDYAHHGQVSLVYGFDAYRARSAGRGDCLRVGFTGECGHNWTVCFSFHKGQMFVYAEMDAPNPEGGVV